MTPDPRWLEILKASGWQTAAAAAAFGLLLFGSHWSWIGPLGTWQIPVTLGFLLATALTVTSIVSATLRFFPLEKWIVHWITIYKAKSGLERYIPYMTPKEKEIIGYLLAKNTKTFTAEANGGHAATLLSRGIVIVLATPGQHLDPDNVPMTVPDVIWDVLMKHKEQFQYRPPKPGKLEAAPWRVSWMER